MTTAFRRTVEKRNKMVRSPILPTEKSAKLTPFRLIASLYEKLIAYLAKKLPFATPRPKGEREQVMPMPLASSGTLWHKAGMPEDARNIRTRLQRLLREALTLTKSLPQPETVQEAPASFRPYGPSRFHVERYPNTRFFALYDGEELLAVTVYRKGAEAVRDRLQAYEARIAALMQGQRDDIQGTPEPPGAVGRLQAERAQRRKHQR